MLRLIDKYRATGSAWCPVVWEEVKKLLMDPDRIATEYERHLNKKDKSPLEHTYRSIEKQKAKIEKSIGLLIDSYTQGYITKEEFEPRISTQRNRLNTIKKQQEKLVEQREINRDLALVINNLEEFIRGITQGIDCADWHAKRDVIRKLIKRIEIGDERINIVYKIPQLAPRPPSDDSAAISFSREPQHCGNRASGSEGDCR